MLMAMHGRRVHLPQKVVLLVALAAALDVVGRYLISLGGGTPADFGWFGYAPLTQANQVAGVGLASWVQLLIWLGVIAVWLVLALRILRPPRPDS
jgi:heme/copper-type cytochrome/quinol oxidase subunit 1